MNWEEGDIALIAVHSVNMPLDTQVEIVKISDNIDRGDCIIDVPGYPSNFPSGMWAAYFRQLKPIDDGNELTSWSDCVWQPRELVRVTGKSATVADLEEVAE